MKMFLGGEWTDRDQRVEVVFPWDQSVIDSVPSASVDDVQLAVRTLSRGAASMRQLAAAERSEILERSARMLFARQEEFAQVISREEGKVIAESRVEAARAAEVLRLSAQEALRLSGEVVPLDAAPGGAGRLGFTLRIPCGIVAAITPFNFPLNLVCHKVGPALAGGNAVLIKPASDTPLSALMLTEVLLDAGVPPMALACMTGPGSVLGQAICAHPQIRKISFTGSYEVGDTICRHAGMKRVTMELGSNSPVVVLADADIEQAAAVLAQAGFANAGQVCISAQRVLVDQQIKGDFLDALKPRVEGIVVGDPFAEQTKMGPMVRAADAARVEAWIQEAVEQGARLVTGGERDQALHSATVLDNVRPDMRVSREELFGPAVAITNVESLEQAIQLANDTRYGLSASVFTQDLNQALQFVNRVDAGNVHVNWSSQWRADLMPYGGLKQSGMGKEGPKYAIREMTEEKMIVIHG